MEDNEKYVLVIQIQTCVHRLVLRRKEDGEECIRMWFEVIPKITHGVIWLKNLPTAWPNGVRIDQVMGMWVEPAFVTPIEEMAKAQAAVMRRELRKEKWEDSEESE